MTQLHGPIHPGEVLLHDLEVHGKAIEETLAKITPLATEQYPPSQS